MTKLILIRHGESEANRQKRFAGHYNAKLQDMGLEQAKVTAQYIAEHYQVDAIYASDLVRAYETGKCVADLLKLPIIADRNLREIQAGEWEGIPFDDLEKLYAEDFGCWQRDIGNSRCTGGESVKQLGERIYTALTRIVQENPDRTVVIATHATPIRVMECLISRQSLDEMKEIPWVSNASLTEMFYENGVWSLGQIGFDEHLAEYRTALAANV